MVANASGRRRRAAWLLPSLALHAVLLGYGAWRHAQRDASAPTIVAPVSALEVEMLEPPAEAAAEPSPPQPATEGARGAALRSAVPRAAATSALATAAPDAEPRSPGMTAEAGDAGAEAAGAAPEAAGPAPRVATPGLSLSQLGLGDGNPFVRPGDASAAREEKAARVKRRLDRALAQGLMDQDSARGRGAGGSVMRVLEATVYASTAPLNGHASFVFVIDGDGKVVSTTLGDASGDRQAWARVARRTAQALAQKKLTVPKGKGVRLTVAVTSHLEMPSGADPGLAVDVLGLPLKRGEGPRSAKVDVLNPLKPMSPLSVMGDPADIGAKARRMVRAHVVGEELL